MVSSAGVPLSRELIDNCTQAIFTPMAVRAALQLDVFTPLANGPMTAVELADTLGVDARRLEMLLYQLVVGKFLDIKDGCFANTNVSNHYLVQGRPTYIGGIHALWTLQWNALLRTAESVRTNVPQDKFDFANRSEEELTGFLRGLHGNALATGRNLARTPIFTDLHRIVDVGGGSGGLAIALCQERPHLSATVIELPSVVPVTRKFVAEAGLENRIVVESADILERPLPGEFDAAIARALFQVLSEEQSRRAARNIAAALPSGGIFYVIGNILDDTRLSPEKTVGINTVFINLYDNGQAYTESQYRDWLSTAGFVDISREPLMLGQSLMTAYKA